MARPGRTSILEWMSYRRTKVMIAGAGVAALEALIALHELAAGFVDVELVTPTPEFAYRPLAVAEPFGFGEVRRFDVVRIASDHGAAVHIAGVQTGGHREQSRGDLGRRGPPLRRPAGGGRCARRSTRSPAA